MAPVSSDAPIIEGRAVEKFYAQPDGSRVEVIVPTDIAGHPGEFLALLGPSGGGKSTDLRRFGRVVRADADLSSLGEPFSALDVLTAETLRGELLELCHGHKIPTRAIFMVPHNIEEAVALADRIGVLSHNPARVRADFA